MFQRPDDLWKPVQELQLEESHQAFSQREEKSIELVWNEESPLVEVETFGMSVDQFLEKYRTYELHHPLDQATILEVGEKRDGWTQGGASIYQIDVMK